MMAIRPSILFLVLFFAKNGCSGANILAVVPTPSFSHQAAFRPLWRSLSGRGHNVTLITTNPMNELQLSNLKEVDISYFYKTIQKFEVIDVAIDDSSSILTIFSSILNFILSTTKAFLESSDGQNLIHNKDNQFDVVIAETVSPSLTFFGWRYQAPLIGICSLDCGMQLHDGMGNPVHPILNPDPNLAFVNADHPLFYERLTSFGYSLFYRAMMYFKFFKTYHALLEQYFDEKVPSLEEIHSNISMLFISTSPVFHTLRPLTPNTITIGNGIHLVGAKRKVLHKIAKNMYGICKTILFLSIVSNSLQADILAIIITASFSHQAPFRPLWKELARRGHNITLVTTDLMTDPEIDNINQIDISYGYDIIQKYKAIDYAMSDTKNTYEIGNAFGKASIETHKVFLESSEGQNLIHNPDNNFDLFIVEAQYEGTSIYSWKFDIPTIGICSMDCSIQFHDAVGNFVHPITNPDQNISIEDIHSTSFWERLYSFLFLLAYRFIISALAHPKQTQILKTYFGENVPPIENIKNNIDMLFLATNPVFQPVRAVMPNTITIGSGTLISDPQPLRQEIQDFLDSANSGAIYFSLGSNIKARHMNLTIKRSIIKAFSTMPYKVLWKIEDDFENLPSNVFTSKWFTSQPDILHHSNIKLFITQGGLQSMQESLHANKPMIGIPFFGDQFGNINRMVQLGYGLKINKYNITEHSIRETVTEIMSNPKYLRNAHKYGNILRDVDISDVEKAVWWTEYVIRHKGAKHFRNAALDMPFWKRYMLDVYAVTALFNVIIFLISLFIFRKFVRLVKMLFL